MKDTVVISDSEQLKHISELFNEDYENLDLRPEDMNCDSVPGVRLMVQPRCITYSRVKATPVQDLVFREAINCLQPYMQDKARSIILLRERFNFIVNIDMSKIAHLACSTKRIEKFCRDLEKLRFNFSWDQREVTDEQGVLHPSVQYSYSGIIFIGHVRRKGSLIYGMHINPMAVPYLLFIGKEVGYSTYDGDILSHIGSVYGKALYMFLCDWAGRGGLMEVTLEDFRTMLGLPDSYRYYNVKKRVLEPMMEDLEAMSSDVQFSYDEVYDSASVTKKRVSGLKFFAYRKSEHTADAVRKMLFSALGAIADKERRGAVKQAVDDIMRSGQAARLVGKFRYYSKQAADGRIKDAEFRNVMLKIVRETYGIDLRSARHASNARKAALVEVAKVTSYPGTR